MQDANHNVTSLLDGSGGVLERYVYDPQGAVTVLNGAADLDQAVEWTIDGQGVSDVMWRHLYQGGFFDYATWMYHFRNREYSPVLGRWVQPDPIGYGDGMNVYQGFGSNPVTFVDPMGLAGMPPSQPGGTFVAGTGHFMIDFTIDFKDAIARRGAYSYRNEAGELITILPDPGVYTSGFVAGPDGGMYRYQGAVGVDRGMRLVLRVWRPLENKKDEGPTCWGDSYVEFRAAVGELSLVMTEVGEQAASAIGADVVAAVRTGRTVGGRELPGAERAMIITPGALKAAARIGKALWKVGKAAGKSRLLGKVFRGTKCVRAPGKGAGSKILQVGERDLQKVFTKHGSDFGMTGNWNPARATDVSRAINTHINRPGVQAIKGTYRGQDVIHYLDPKTGLNVISDPSGGFIGGWKLGADQLKSVLTNGRLF